MSRISKLVTAILTVAILITTGLPPQTVQATGEESIPVVQAVPVDATTSVPNDPEVVECAVFAPIPPAWLLGLGCVAITIAIVGGVATVALFTVGSSTPIEYRAKIAVSETGSGHANVQIPGHEDVYVMVSGSPAMDPQVEEWHYEFELGVPAPYLAKPLDPTKDTRIENGRTVPNHPDNDYRAHRTAHAEYYDVYNHMSLITNGGYQEPGNDPNFKCFVSTAFRIAANQAGLTSWEHTRYLWTTVNPNNGNVLVYLWGEPGYWRVVDGVRRWFPYTRKLFGITGYYYTSGSYSDFLHKITVKDRPWYNWRSCNVGGGPPMAPARVASETTDETPDDPKWIPPGCKEIIDLPGWWKPWWGDPVQKLQQATHPPDWVKYWSSGRPWPGPITKECLKVLLPVISR